MGGQQVKLERTMLSVLVGRYPALEGKLARRFGRLLVGYLLGGSWVLNGCDPDECLTIEGDANRKVAAVLATAQKLAEESSHRSSERALGETVKFLGRLRKGTTRRAIQKIIRGESVDYPAIELEALYRLRRDKRAISRYLSARGTLPEDSLRLLRRARQEFHSALFSRLGGESFPTLRASAA